MKETSSKKSIFKFNTPQAESFYTSIFDSLQIVPLQQGKPQKYIYLFIRLSAHLDEELSLQEFPFLSIWAR